MAKPLKCDLCDEAATVHLTQIINNQIHKIDLCEACAEKKGITDPSGYSLADLLVKPGSAEESSSSASDDFASIECDTCGYTQREFKKTGRLGCPDCYASFNHLVDPALSGMHKGTAHQGKVPSKALERKTFMDRINSLESNLQDAIDSERYEDAAKFRDELIELRKTLEAETEEQ